MEVFETPRPITLADRERIEGLYLRHGRGDSAHAFASLYLWQDGMGLSLAAGEDGYAVRTLWKGEGAWFFPVGGEEVSARCVEALLEGGLRRLCYVTAEDAALLERHFPGVFALRETPEDSEYLYDRREMIDMPGAPFAKIRNRYRRLEREHGVTAAEITGAALGEVGRVIRQWSRNTDTDEGVADAAATDRILADWDALGLRGVLLSLDGEPWAVAAGYPLRAGDFDCCLLKARENVPGVTDHLRAALARSLDGVARLNFEEDLGVEGLRQMKERLRPCGKIEMYTGERR